MATIVRMEGIRGRQGWAVARLAGLSILALAGSSLVVLLLERVVEVPSAASVYLLAVIIAGAFGGTLAAVGTAIASAFLYDFFFVEPIYTLRIADASELLNLLLFLAVGIAVGRLSGLQAERATEAAERARDAQALFAVSRSIATSDDLSDRRRDRPAPARHGGRDGAALAGPRSVRGHRADRGRYRGRDAIARRRRGTSSSSDRSATNRRAGRAPTSAARSLAARPPERPSIGSGSRCRARSSVRSGRYGPPGHPIPTRPRPGSCRPRPISSARRSDASGSWRTACRRRSPSGARAS